MADTAVADRNVTKQIASITLAIIITIVGVVILVTLTYPFQTCPDHSPPNLTLTKLRIEWTARHIQLKRRNEDLLDPISVICNSHCPDWIQAFTQIFVEVPPSNFNLDETNAKVSLKIFPKINLLEIRTFNLSRMPLLKKALSTQNPLWTTESENASEIALRINLKELPNDATNVMYNCSTNSVVESEISFCNSSQLIHKKKIAIFRYLFRVEQFLIIEGNMRMHLGNNRTDVDTETRVFATIVKGETNDEIVDRIENFEKQRQKVCQCHIQRHNDGMYTSTFSAVDIQCVMEINPEEELRLLFQDYFLCHGFEETEDKLSYYIDVNG